MTGRGAPPSALAATLGSPRRPLEVPDGGRGTGDSLRRRKPLRSPLRSPPKTATRNASIPALQEHSTEAGAWLGASALEGLCAPRAALIVHVGENSKKFKAAFDYFQANRYDACLVLSGGDVVPSDVVWSDAIIGLLANTGARFSVFYSDFAYDKNLNVIIETPPAVELELLLKASNDLEKASKEFHI